ncbi:MAG: hypothetical protein GY723_06310 [bacterium]|nr:hypothetical protein [bacterium]
MQRLHHQHEGLKAQYEPVREFYDAEESPREKGPRSLELHAAEETDMAVDDLQGIAESLVKAARINDALIRQKWQVKQKERLS